MTSLYNTILFVVIVILLSSVMLLLLSNRDYNNITQIEAKRSKYSSGNDNAKQLDEQKPSIQICCGWSPDKIGNEGTGLTYRIIGASPAAEQAVHNAISTWANNIKHLKFIELKSSDNSAPDITLKFNSKSSQAKMAKEIRLPDNIDGNGTSLEVTAPGASRIHVTLARVITGVDTTISKSAFGDKLSSDMIEQITKHELGHALGLGEANFDGDVMSPTLNDESNSLSQCDINAVKEANHILTLSNGNENNIQYDSFNCS